MKCENCNNEHDGSYGSGRFCSRACANSRKFSQQVKEKISLKLKRNIYNFCVCGKKLSKNNRTGFCLECRNKNNKNNKKNSCKICGKVISKNKTGMCSSCLVSSKKEEHISNLKSGNIIFTGSSILTIKKYMLEKQNNKCLICGNENVWCGKELIFVLDHIDGNSTNNHEDNLRLICPNCDSQTSTFKSKNKGKGRDYDRSYRKFYYHDNKLERWQRG